VAGVGTTPKSNLEPLDPPFVEYVDLWIPPRIAGINPAQDYAPFEMPVLRGMSGGGCWKTNVRPSPAEWRDSRICLTGIHIASNDDREKDRFMREVLIGHHLKMIARDFPDIQSLILRRWPQLEDARWL
jgi:hypothetical protein